MADNKKQHYVPKFYLRNFASDEARKNIFIFNIKRRQLFSGGITGQCYRAYFYGRDTPAERTLTHIEGDAAKIINEIIDTSRMPTCRMDLRLFFAIQLTRTAASLDHAQKMLAEIDDVALGHFGGMSDVDAINLMITTAIVASPSIHDLSWCVIVNESAVKFFTCDNPIAIVNRFRTRDNAPPTRGLVRAGIEIYLPISPRHVLLLFDKRVHRPDGRTPDGVVTVRRDDDVRLINDLQVLSSRDNIYCSTAVEEDEIKRAFDRGARRRDLSKPTFTVMVETDNRNEFVNPARHRDLQVEGRRKFLAMDYPPLRVDRSVPFLRRSVLPRYYDDGTARGPIRDLAWSNLTSDLKEALHSGEIRWGQMREYIRAHPLFPEVGAWKSVDYGPA